MTNYEKIKQLSIEETAEYFAERCYCDFCVNHPSYCNMECYAGIRRFLESEEEI